MNEQIQELWKRAGGHYNRGNQHTWPEYTIDDPEKFAELIVRECIDVVEDAGGIDKYHYIGAIGKHFGVEE
jgi:hypothetical protein